NWTVNWLVYAQSTVTVPPTLIGETDLRMPYSNCLCRPNRRDHHRSEGVLFGNRLQSCRFVRPLIRSLRNTHPRERPAHPSTLPIAVFGGSDPRSRVGRREGKRVLCFALRSRQGRQLPRGAERRQRRRQIVDGS